MADDGTQRGEAGIPSPVPPPAASADDSSVDDERPEPEFYDPLLDEMDALWTMQRRHGRPSDAILNCPGCLETLCIDCQRHEVYTGQFRAMFVRGCAVDRSSVHQLPAAPRRPSVKPGKKMRRRRKHAAAATAPPESDAPSEERTEAEAEAGSSVATNGRARDDAGASPSLAVPLAAPPQSEPAGHVPPPNMGPETMEAGSDDPGPSASTGAPPAIAPPTPTVVYAHPRHAATAAYVLREGEYHGVSCAGCGTAVALLDSDGVYHFYDVFPSEA